jgi:Cu2+-containing amine oxidase
MLLVPLSKIIRPLSVVLVLLLWLSRDAVAQRKPDFTDALKVAKVSAPLTNEERTLAVRLAEQALKENKLFTDKKMYLTEARFNRDTASEIKGVFERLALLTYYRYEGDLTIEVFINLTRQQVLAVKQLQKLIPPISPEEFSLAKELVFNDPKLKDVLGPYRDRLVVEPFTSRSESPEDPLFRHRVVYMLFRTGSTYLVPESRVFVDLTAEKVIIKPTPGKEPM